MKFLNVLFLSVLFFSSVHYSSIASQNNEGERKRYAIKDIKELNEIAKKTFSEDCTNYNKGFSMSLFGDRSPTKVLQNCINYAFDNGLKPICEQEEDLEELLKYYEGKEDFDKIEEIEEQLMITEDIKYGLANDLYEVAAQFDEVRKIEIDGLVEEIKKEYPALVRFLLSLTQFELSSFTGLLDIKVNQACSIDHSRIDL